MKYKNNPFNLRYDPSNNWKGQIDPKNGFCQFSEMKYGYRAVIITLFNYVKVHKIATPREIINRYAPLEDGNNPSAYLRVLRPLISLDDDVRTASDLFCLLYGMYTVEQGSEPSLFDVAKYSQFSFSEQELDDMFSEDV